ncbi:MAG: hypothetical protein JWL77_1106 [Chthonomonadaceae bacterium]|nr:hypothetical protein [Chthonomonadaceae bacterium]
MPGNKKYSITPDYEPGEVLALLTPLQELPTGMYLLQEVLEDWVVLRRLIDDEKTEQLILTEHLARLPARLLLLFMPVGLQIRPDKSSRLPH